MNITMNLCGMADMQNVFPWMKQLKEWLNQGGDKPFFYLYLFLGEINND
jgi:hypothetical protein